MNPSTSTSTAPAGRRAGPGPDRYAVIGHPVAHSRSPFIHAEFARQTGQHLVYGRIDCGRHGFDDAVRAFADSADAAAGLGPARGVNVTVPFKFHSMALARQASARAQLAQAANVLRFDAGGWQADNTDGIGLVRDIEQGAAWPLAGQRVLLIGAGGAASGVLGPLIETRPAQVMVANRTPDRARTLAARHAALAARHGVRLDAGGLAEVGDDFDVVLNSSASSLAGDDIPVPDHVLRPGALAIDLMYGPAARPFLDWAARHGAIGRDGLGMLVEQAAEAFRFWRGVMPQTAPVLAALRQQLHE
jgi:shikimate dehydrogenase